VRAPLQSRHLDFAARIVVAALVALTVTSDRAAAVLVSNFNESGTTVNGYQDDFDGAALNPDWLLLDGGGEDGPALFTLSGAGTLLLNPALSDPNKLLYNPASGYDNSVQEILALIRVVTDPDGEFDGFRGGVTVGANTGDGQGINLLFREPNQNGTGYHFNFLDDLRAWGDATNPLLGGDTWKAGDYKWLRLRQDSNGDNFAKIWDAGTTPEPASFDLAWQNRGRIGLAGLTTNSNGGQAVLEVDYLLIKADGLPAITVAVPEPGSAVLLALAGSAIFSTRRRRA
jgi:hypothetical protein